MRNVRVAVVGCGSVSAKYLPHVQESSAVELVAFCDPLVERVQRHAQAYSIEKEDFTG